MTKQPTRAERAAEREADLAGRRQHWLEVERPKMKAKVLAEVERRGLASFMNRTRWERLCEAVYAELPFPPAFDLQTVLGQREPLMDTDAPSFWGSWSELEPFFEIEWLRVAPRWSRHVAMLLPDEVIDCGDAFRDLLVRLGVPFREDEAKTFWIYGYAPADPATLTSPPETPT
ncbi:DUF6678 family protein [Brevundimonas sp.]|uniref:DUF6678 family protein n=1 Tax=Brevundimonas sp. TaxID=1871086 RepID=UPI002737AF2D|nr:DUF6678 family protein [Brevundimonas sp.]MDP3803345.1 hypothetical protein [Brevundimonas sp.]